MTIGDRLKEERERLGYTQQEFIDLTKEKRGEKKYKKVQIDYEKGNFSPTAKYLAVIAAAGADVQYILTGIRLLKIADKNGDYIVKEGALSKDEETMLETYRALRKSDRAHAKAVITALASKNMSKDKTG